MKSSDPKSLRLGAWSVSSPTSRIRHVAPLGTCLVWPLQAEQQPNSEAGGAKMATTGSNGCHGRWWSLLRGRGAQIKPLCLQWVYLSLHQLFCRAQIWEAFQPEEKHRIQQRQTPSIPISPRLDPPFPLPSSTLSLPPLPTPPHPKRFIRAIQPLLQQRGPALVLLTFPSAINSTFITSCVGGTQVPPLLWVSGLGLK